MNVIAREEGSEEQERSSPGWFWVLPFAISLGTWLLLRNTSFQQREVGAVFSLSVTLWVTNLLPLAVTSLLSTALLVLVAGVGEKEAFSAYGDPVVLLFIGSFLLAKGMQIVGLDERLAWWILSKDWTCKSPSRLLLTCGAISSVISLFVSNTATAAMLLPVVVKVLDGMTLKRTAFSASLMLMLTWGASVAVGFPVGTPPNLIGLELIRSATGRHISFLQWMAFGMPISVVMLIACWGILVFLGRKDSVDISAAKGIADERLRIMPPVSRGEKIVLISFFTALTLWVLPDLVAAAFQLFLGSTPRWSAIMQARITPTVAVMVAVALLFLLPARRNEGSRSLAWRELARIDWGVVILFGGGIALGQAMFSSGLAKVIGQSLATASGAESVWAITALCTAAAILMSELASNTAAATAIVPVAIGLAQGSGISPIAPALGAALGASLGFMLPVSTPPNAIVYSSGHVPPGQMIRRGLVIDLVGFAVILSCLYLILPLLGLA